MWSAAVQKFINELFLNVRRVLTIPTSPDGFTWTPNLPSHYKGGTKKHKGMHLIHAPLMPAEYQILPGELDPADLEFYVATPFEYERPYFMTVSNYAGTIIPLGISPVRQDAHATALGTELWISRYTRHEYARPDGDWWKATLPCTRLASSCPRGPADIRHLVVE